MKVTRATHLLIGGALVVLGLLVLGVVLLFGRGDVRSHVADTYTFVAREGRSAEYSSDKSPSTVASSIAAEWKPAERHTDPSGVFLRYRNDIVAVTSDGGTGSRIFVDDSERGYARWYPYIGGYWGTYSAPGDGIRGGGPGAGK